MPTEEGKPTTVPNTTQIPHFIIRDLMPNLKDVELRVLFIVTDQTLGWIEDAETGRRKEKDWISRGQLMKKTGRSPKHISKAVDSLIKAGVIEAHDGSGNPLDTPQKRQAKFGKIYYRLNTRYGLNTLFSAVGQKDTRTKRPTQKGHTTKETVLQNTISRAAEPPARENEETSQKPKPDAPRKPHKPHTPHAEFVAYWFETVKAARGIKPIITKADAANLKRVLDLGILTQSQLEQLALYFLANFSFREFSPSISTFLSAGVLNGLMNRAQNETDFWQKLNGYAATCQIHRRPPEESRDIAARLAELKKALFKPAFTPQARTAIQEIVAAEERAARR